MPVTLKPRREWFGMLAKIVSPMKSPEVLDCYLTAYIPMLKSWDDQYFNPKTLEAAARRDEGDTAIPNYDKVVRVFAAYRKEFVLTPQERHGGIKPIARLVGPSDDGPPLAAYASDEERQHVAQTVSRLRGELSEERKLGKLKVKPLFLSPLQLALAAIQSGEPDPLAGRPDWQKAYNEHLSRQSKDD